MLSFLYKECFPSKMYKCKAYLLIIISSSLSDINECLSGPCDQTCTNTAGSFTCSCTDGFTLEADGTTCVDDNECEGSANNCEQLCVNTPGSFTCECDSGYDLDSDGVTCSGKCIFIC